jgi:glycosyltransferase involved in cell wall biosynthesis
LLKAQVSLTARDSAQDVCLLINQRGDPGGVAGVDASTDVPSVFYSARTMPKSIECTYPIKLSLILIARNESENLKACLDSATMVDELVVVEHGSDDDTFDVAVSSGANVIRAPDWPGFGPQKNRALERARGEWVLSLDADERLTLELMKEVRAAIESGRADAYEIPRLTQFCGKWIRHSGWTPDYVLRLFKKSGARFSDDLVHERVLMRDQNARVARLRHPILHFSYPDPASYWKKLQRYSHDWAKQKYQRGERATISRAAISGMVAFIRSYLLHLGFLDGAMGFAVCTMQAHAAFGKYFELYCLNQNVGNDAP